MFFSFASAVVDCAACSCTVWGRGWVLACTRGSRQETTSTESTPQTMIRFFILNPPRRLFSEFLVIRIGSGYHKLFGTGVQYCALRVVGSVRQTGHLDLQRDRIFRLAHVGIHVERDDLFCGGVKSEGHSIARLSIVRENQIYNAAGRVQRHLARLKRLLHSLRVGRHVHAEDALYVFHVVLHLSFFLRDHTLLHPPAAGLLRGRTDRSLLNLPVGAVLAKFFRGRFWISLQRELSCFSPLILAQPLLVLRGSLLHGCELLLQFAILCHRRKSDRENHSKDCG